MQTILLLGKNGQVGWELQRSLQPLGYVVALDRQTNVDGLCGDITDFNAIRAAIQSVQPTIIVNATAYTAVDRAESEQDQADLVNHLAVRNLADFCKENAILLVHYSTDYVFSGQGNHAWLEDDQAEPQNIYGKTKHQGELVLEQSGAQFLNFRTSWVYASRGQNFIKTMLKLATTKNELSVIADQIGAPTGAALIADITAQALKFYTLQDTNRQAQLFGHYHLAAMGETSWFDYAQFIFKHARAKGQILALQKVHPIATAQYPMPAKRPLNSRLNTTKLQQSFQVNLPHWQLGVEQVLEEIL